MFMTGAGNPDLVLDTVTCLWYIHDLIFGCLHWFWRCKELPCPLSLNWGFKILEVPDCDLDSWYWFGYGTCLWYIHVLNFGCLHLFWDCKEHSLNPDWPIGGHWRFLTKILDLDLDLGGFTGLWYTKYWLYTMILKMQRTSM